MKNCISLNAEIIASTLGKHTRNTGGSIVFSCQAHDDGDPSLSSDDGEPGRPLVKCFSGSTQEAVVASLKSPGLWPEMDRPPQAPLNKPKTDIRDDFPDQDVIVPFKKTNVKRGNPMNNVRSVPAKHKTMLKNGRSSKPPAKFEDWWAKVPISHVVHPAWRSLAPAAKDVMIVCIGKAGSAASKGIKDVKGRPKFNFVYKEAIRLLSISVPTFNHALDVLKERGFIGVSDPGGTLNGKGRPAQYFLKDSWKDWQPPPKKISNIEKFQKARRDENDIGGFKVLTA